MTEPQAGGRRSLAAVLLGWAAVAAALGYAVLVHYGVGPINQGREWHWYTPRSFLLDVDLLYPVFESVGRALVGVGIPAAALAILVIGLCRSAVGRALALASLVAVLLFVFYGVQAPFVWNFFHWRASAVLSLMALVVGFSLAAPWLAQSWLRLSWPLRLLVYLPIVFAVFAFVRNATGTDESLLYSISPWPAVPVFGIEVGALFVAAWLVGTGVGLRAIALPGGWPRRLAGLLLAVALPVLLLWFGSWLGLFPFLAGPRTFLGAALATALSIAVAAAVRRGGDRLRQRARHLLVGAALIGIPLISSEAVARYDVLPHARDPRPPDHRGARFLLPTRDGVPGFAAPVGRVGGHRRDPAAVDRLPLPGRGEVPLPELRHQLHPRVRRAALGRVRLHAALLGGGGRRRQRGARGRGGGLQSAGRRRGAPGQPRRRRGPRRRSRGREPTRTASLGEAWSCPSKPPELW